jgi:hypothetical protein
MTLDVRFSIWMASTTRWSCLTKVIALAATPRVGEYVTFRTAAMRRCFVWRITEVTHREGDSIEVSAQLVNDVGQREYSFESERDFDAHRRSYLAEGWSCEQGIGLSRRTERIDEPCSSPS